MRYGYFTRRDRIVGSLVVAVLLVWLLSLGHTGAVSPVALP